MGFDRDALVMLTDKQRLSAFSSRSVERILTGTSLRNNIDGIIVTSVIFVPAVPEAGELVGPEEVLPLFFASGSPITEEYAFE